MGQAERINATAHDVLKYVRRRDLARNGNAEAHVAEGNRPQTFDAAEAFFDLADFLGPRRATGSLPVRSAR